MPRSGPLQRPELMYFAGVRRQADVEKYADLSQSVTPLILDITDGNAIRSAARLVADRTGEHGLDALINNAGYAFACPLEFVPLEQLRQQFEVNVIGQLAVTQAYCRRCAWHLVG